MSESIGVGNNISCKAKIYRDVLFRNTSVGDFCEIADDTSIYESTLSEKVFIGRRNLVMSSFFSRGCYTGSNAVIMNAFIGKYCNISWNVSIGARNHNYYSPSEMTDYWWNKIFGSSESLPESQDKAKQLRGGKLP